ncbi:MAG: cytochrome c oxidase subunit II [Candidatus Krumholzibacteriota bacterium]
MIGSAILATWFPEAASTHAAGVDEPFYWIYIAAVLALFLFVGLAAIFLWIFRRQDRNQLGAETGRLNPVFLGLWILGALGLAVFAFVAGFPGFIDQNAAPYGAYGIDVTARQWGWDFVYPNGHVADTLHVATGTPVHLTLGTEDVEHGLSIPAMRVNQAVIPGSQSETWFEATTAGTYQLRGSIFDGDGFSSMNSALVVHEPQDFVAWMNEVSDIFKGRTMPEVGELLYTRLGCMACHTTNGQKLVGPTFLDMYGFEFDTVEGTRITVDDAYIRESILEPNVSVIAGFQPVMTPFAGLVTDQEIEAITAWLKTLSSKGGDGDNTESGEAAGQEEN